MSSQKPIKKVIIISTGGTIASVTRGEALSGSQIIQSVPAIGNIALVHGIEFSRIGSSKMTPVHWLQLAQLINKTFASDPGIAGIVVTHGTDTLEETAFFLHLTIKDKRPVVLTGSMRTPDELSADGPANLFNAVRLAVDSQAQNLGVLVAFNEEIISARDVWKTHNRRVHTFGSHAQSHLGSIDPDTIIITHRPRRSHTIHTPFQVADLQTLPAVPIITDYTDFNPNLLIRLREDSVAGLIFQSFAGGRMSHGAQKGLSAVNDLMPVVICSKVPQGRISSQFNTDRAITLASDLPANKARILLMLALAHEAKPEQIRQYFDTF